jgi:predicted TIM-barrel fold metal-dependent hydrolase
MAHVARSRAPTANIQPGDVIDIHVHIGGPPGENDHLYYYSTNFQKSISFEAMRLVTRLYGARMTGLQFASVLFDQLRGSRYVDKAVLLALDQVYREDGRPAPERTGLFAANEYVAALYRLFPGFLFGCSVHPYDPHAIERLYQCVRDGAVLCKWVPSAQEIDPTHPLSRRFYRALAALNLPLLLHVGPEETVPTHLKQRDVLLFNAAAGHYGKQWGAALDQALDAGATVIVAHSALPLGALFDKHNKYWEKVFDAMLARFGAQFGSDARLYTDMSAYCLPGRGSYIERLMPLIREYPERFLFGSDFPIPIVSMRKGALLDDILDTFGWLATRVLPANEFDKNYSLLRSRLPAAAFTSAAAVLRDPRRRVIDWPRLQRILRERAR